MGCKYTVERNLGNDRHDHSTTKYMDKILPNFDPITSRVDNCGHFTQYLPFVTWPSMEFQLTLSLSLTPYFSYWPYYKLTENLKGERNINCIQSSASLFKLQVLKLFIASPNKIIFYETDRFWKSKRYRVWVEKLYHKTYKSICRMKWPLKVKSCLFFPLAPRFQRPCVEQRV